jgi:hypothetical protein
MTGRPTKLTAKVSRAICDAIREGLSIDGASAKGGIHPSTFHDWIARGVAGEQPFADFAEQAAQARAHVEARLLESVEWAAGERIRLRALGSGESAEVIEDVERDWRAAAWLLERKFPEAYGNRAKVEHAGSVGARVELELPEGAGDAAVEFVKRLGLSADGENG